MMNEDFSVAENLAAVHHRIQRACADAGRDPATVRLLAVSKTFGIDAVTAAHAAGQCAFGENQVQEALEKIAASRGWQPATEWHLIGPLQSNKTRAVAESFDWVHSVDRLKIAQRLSEQRPAGLPPLQVCLQVNTSGEASKSGCTVDEAPALARAVAALAGLRLRGLMAVPEPSDQPPVQRAQHRRLRELFGAINAAGLDGTPPMDSLSMGMSADLESAIAEGATWVRVGTAIFGGRARSTPPFAPPWQGGSGERGAGG
jgi:pyridoxal phosphate enzyme (YggS family)